MGSRKRNKASKNKENKALGKAKMLQDELNLLRGVISASDEGEAILSLVSKVEELSNENLNLQSKLKLKVLEIAELKEYIALYVDDVAPF